MVDIHHHLLWALDDGSKDLDMSLGMARASAQDGVTHIVCTPHSSGSWTFNPQVNRAKATELQALLDAEKIPIQIGLGCDFHLSYDNIVEAKADPARYSINGLGYLMVELPDYGIPRGLTETFYELQLAGLTPVLTHPERNPTLQNDYETRLGEWMRGGVLVQVTGDSVIGKMGKSAQRVAHALLDRRWVHFLATDAHNLTSRAPRLGQARDFVAKKFGEGYAESLVTTNPRAAFDGRPFEPFEEPRGLYESLEPKPWWKRILSR